MAEQDRFDDRGLLEQKVSSERAFDGVLMRVNVDQVRLPSGALAIREYTVHPGAAMIIPVFDDGTILLERQFRYPIGQVMIEFPAGKLDPHEEPLECARRELLEETGYYAHRLQHLTHIHPVISYSTERIEIFLATQLEQRQAQLDDEEFLQTFRATPAELMQWIRDGKVTDVKTQIGAFWLDKMLGGHWPGIKTSAP
ncbi:MAG: NUDIX hydrolase [Burkholderiaceae bacterium]|nr:MAG: NUDIX hydrolase [Burkholderiaceae bacterium]